MRGVSKKHVSTRDVKFKDATIERRLRLASRAQGKPRGKSDETEKPPRSPSRRPLTEGCATAERAVDVSDVYAVATSEFDGANPLARRPRAPDGPSVMLDDVYAARDGAVAGMNPMARSAGPDDSGGPVTGADV